MRKRGATLIMVAAVLSILAAMATGFYTLMLMQTKSAIRNADSVRADMVARAGIEFAIASLREQAFRKTESPSDAWYGVDYLRGARASASFPDGPYLHNGADDDGDGVADNPSEALLDPERASYSRAVGCSAGPDSDRFTLQVGDAASRININSGDNLAVILDNLCRVIGPPLAAASLDAIQPRRWGMEMDGGDPARALYDTPLNAKDTADTRDLCFRLSDKNGTETTNGSGRPVRAADGRALYGDGYAIAGYRSRRGAFRTVEDVKNALTYVERSTPPNGLPDEPLERLEIEVKFAALRDHITTASWVDTNTVCVGKFEWVAESSVDGQYCQMLIDRDKSWVADSPKDDPLNTRGSLRGSYVSILNGHGAGQLRRIATNGADWIALRLEEKMTIEPGPVSSYLIIAAEDAILEDLDGAPFADFPAKLPPPGRIYLPKLAADGTPVDNPKIDYARFPLCIHRAPVNINTASDKVLAALTMGISVQHGHYMAVGTDTDLNETLDKWYRLDPHGIEPQLATYRGLKRLPVRSGKPAFDRTLPTMPPATGYDFTYLTNYGTLDPAGTQKTNEAQELGLRIILARTSDPKFPYFDPLTLQPLTAAAPGALKRGPFCGYDDFYFRVVKPWDEQRVRSGWVDKNGDGKMDAADEYHKASLARLIMAHFNSNTDLLKFNPNIEWIDRWGRNFTEMEPVMVHTDQPEPHTSNPSVAEPLTQNSIPIYTTADSWLKSSQRDANGNYIPGAYITRNYRYKSDELIDKSDLNRSTTEFTFNSNGIFQITSTGQIVQRTGETLSERKLEALVQVYDVWRESTQRQFVQGKITKAAEPCGGAGSGQVTRDAYNVSDRLALVTLPEPLVPLRYTIRDQTGQPNPRNAEVVDPTVTSGQKRNIFGRATDINIPDSVINRILPAGYDGQIVLATNTSAYDPQGDKDTFLATFDGDLDTATCGGNGHEQAKVPHIEEGSLNGVDMKGKGHFVRVVDTCGLLGVLNDQLIDVDPAVPPVDAGDAINGFRWVYRFVGVNAGLKPLAYKPQPQLPYYNSVSVRQGDLRTDGVYVASPGVSGNEATLKYLFGANKENFKPDASDGNCISMWAKTTWRHDDFRHHEFFNSSNPAQHWHMARGCYIAKYGQYSYTLADDSVGAGHSANRTKINDLMCFWEGNTGDWDCGAMLHGGYAYVPRSLAGESSSFRVQPFRWHFVGARRNHWSDKPVPNWDGDGPRGHWVPYGSQDSQHPKSVYTAQYSCRPFIDSQLHPEGQNTWKPDQFWAFRTVPDSPDGPSVVGNTAGSMDGNGNTGQDAKWEWADPAGANRQKAFGLCNINMGNMQKTTDPMQVFYHYRFMPEDGTYAVIDELKISGKDRVLQNTPDWAKDRVVREQMLSRYYLPQKAGDPSAAPSAGGCPTFTSQTLLQSRLGFDKTDSAEYVTLVRATWTVFTPRFMHEYKEAGGKFKRNEKLTYDRKTQKIVPVPFRGPFNFDAYNDDSYISDFTDDGNGRKKAHVSVARPSPEDYVGGQAHATKGVEVELLKDPDGKVESGDETVIAGPFQDPDAPNAVGSAAKPVRLKTGELRYRVRFKYPVDPLVDPNAAPAMDPARQYMLDTPVFDDISITFIGRPKLFSLREVTE